MLTSLKTIVCVPVLGALLAGCGGGGGGGNSESGHSAMVLQPGPADGVDAWVTSVFDYGGNYGVDDDKLQVGGWGDEYYTLIQFNLAGMPGKASSAILYLYAYSRGDASVPVTMDLYRIGGAWDESVGWYTQPAAELVTSMLPAPAIDAWYAIDITDVYNAWQNGTYPNNGIELRPTANADQFNVFHSSDYTSDPALRPKLEIVP
jgi:hypothetical protein